MEKDTGMMITLYGESLEGEEASDWFVFDLKPPQRGWASSPTGELRRRIEIARQDAKISSHHSDDTPPVHKVNRVEIEAFDEARGLAMRALERINTAWLTDDEEPKENKRLA